MNMYEQYIKERENLEVIKTEKGFIVYRIDFPSCMINDCFVVKGARNERHGTFLTNQVFEICKQAGVKTVYCNTDERANGYDLSVHSIESFGFEHCLRSGNINTYKMEVSEWEKH